MSVAQALHGPLSLALQLLEKRESDPAGVLQLAEQLAFQVIDAPAPSVALSLQVELERIVALPFAADLQGTSVDTLTREDQARVAKGKPSRIIHLSERRVGMRLKHALRLAD
jgi:hypothetical protein